MEITTAAAGSTPWLAAQRRAAQQGRLPDERRAQLDKDFPGWRQSRQERWEASLERLARARAGKAPQDPTAATWLKTQRHSLSSGRLDPGRRAALDRRVPGWDRPGAEREAAWLARAEDVVNHADFAGALPAARARGDEGALGRWLDRQRHLAREGRLARTRLRWLDRRLPGWLPSTEALAKTWDARCAELAQFRADTGRHPRASAPGERRLARWLGTQRGAARAGTLTAARRAALDEAAPGWMETGRRPGDGPR